MNINHVRCFWAVVTTGSFTKAAEQLFTTQSTVSKNIMLLETETGLQLLNRNGKYFSPTDAGNKLLSYYSELLEAYEKAVRAAEELKRLETPVKQSLRVIGGVAMARYGIINSLVRFNQLYSDVSLDIEETEELRVHQALQVGTRDLAFCSDIKLDAELFSWQPYLREGFIATVSSSSPLAYRKSLGVKELAGQKLVLHPRESPLYDLCFSTCFKAGFTPLVVLTTPNPSTALEYTIGNEDCVYIGARNMMRSFTGPSSRQIPLEGFPEYNLVLAWKKTANLSERTRSYLQFVQELSAEEFIRADIARRKIGSSFRPT